MDTGTGIALATISISIAGIAIAYIGKIKNNNNEKYVYQTEFKLMCNVFNKEIREIKDVVKDLTSQVVTMNVNIGKLLVRRRIDSDNTD